MDTDIHLHTETRANTYTSHTYSAMYEHVCAQRHVHAHAYI